MPSDAAREQAPRPEPTPQPGQTEQIEEPEEADGAARGDQDAVPALSAPVLSAPSAPILPAQSREDTDVGWGDYAERDDNDRLLRDRPPHWGNA